MAFSISSATIFLLSAAVFITMVSADNHLLPEERLNSGAFLKEGRYTFVMQEDCNLVLYNLDRREWESGTRNEGFGCFATLQSDGNFVITDRRNKVIWASQTGRENGKYVLILQKNGNVVIYSHPIFSTDMNKIGSADVVANMKGNRKAHSCAK